MVQEDSDSRLMAAQGSNVERRLPRGVGGAHACACGQEQLHARLPAVLACHKERCAAEVVPRLQGRPDAQQCLRPVTDQLSSMARQFVPRLYVGEIFS